MIAGRLNEAVRIWRPFVEVNEFGERVEEWRKIYDTRARVEYTGGSRQIEAGEMWNPYSKRFEVRSYVPVDEQCRVEWQGQLWRVLSVEHSRERNEIILNTELVNE